MKRTTFSVCLTFVLGLLSLFATATQAQSKETKEIYAIVKVHLYEVDDAFHKQLAKAKWLSKTDLEELERRFLNPPKKNLPNAQSVLATLEKQPLLLTGKEIDFEHGQESVVLALNKTTNCLPSPDQLRQGQNSPQTIQEGVSLRVQIHISPDRRHVRAKFIEKSLDLEGIEKVNVLLSNGTEVVGEEAFLKEIRLSQVRDIPDGGAFLLPLQYRSRTARERDRWWVALVVPRIYIEEEEQARRDEILK